jgi:hypothetical protein
MAQIDEKRGGFRPKAGRPKGSKTIRDKLRDEVIEQIQMKNHITNDIRSNLPLGLTKKRLKALEDIAFEELEKDFKRRIGYSGHKLLNAQLSMALGTQTLYKAVNGIDEKGKPTRKHVLVTDTAEIAQFLDDPTMFEGDDYYYITTKQPDNNAINSVLDRLFGKASTKIVGAPNADGSEGPIKVIVANFSAGNAIESSVTQPIIEAIVTDVATEEENVATQPVADESLSPGIPENDQNEEIPVEYNTTNYSNLPDGNTQHGNSDTL